MCSITNVDCRMRFVETVKRRENCYTTNVKPESVLISLHGTTTEIVARRFLIDTHKLGGGRQKRGEIRLRSPTALGGGGGEDGATRRPNTRTCSIWTRRDLAPPRRVGRRRTPLLGRPC